MHLTFEIVSSWVMLWVTTVVLSSFIHFFMIEVKQEKPNYAQWTLIRAFFFILYAIPFNLLSFGEYIPIFIFQLTLHFVIFNPLTNKLRDVKYAGMLLIPRARRYPFWYLGKDSGWLDKLFGTLGLPFYKAVYYLSVVLMILSLITIYDRYA